MADRIRVGIIGVGWGSAVLAPAFNAVPEFELVALCSRREERVRKAAEALGITDISTDWEQLVARDDLDLIAVCTPTDLHHEQTIRALQAGKHVLCEKPVALDTKQAREMLDVAKASGLVHAVDFEGRWLIDRLAVWDAVTDGYVGDPYHLRFTSTADYWHPSRGLQSEWMYSVDDGGGYLMGMGSHDIDFACALLGQPVAVCADVRTTLPSRLREDGTTLAVTADDTSTVLLRFASGATATISTSTMGLHRDQRDLELYGSEGTLTVEGPVMTSPDNVVVRGGRLGDTGLSVLPHSQRMPRSGVELPKRRTWGAVRALALMLEDLLPAFDGQPTRVPDLYDGYVVQAVVDAARRSSAGEGWVPLDLS
jgi:predicted dehydrogenase